MFTRTLTFGEDLRIQVLRSPYPMQHLAVAAAQYEPANPNSYGALQDLDEVPTNPRQRRRVYVLCLALGIDPAYYGLGESDRLGFWPSDDQMRDGLADLLMRRSACFGATAVFYGLHLAA